MTFEEFLVAVVFPEHILEPEILKKAFNLFDADGSGAIELDEMKMVLT